MSNEIYDVDGTTLVMIDDAWSFCNGTIPQAIGEHDTALVMIDITFLFGACDWNVITDAANAKGYKAVLGNYPPEIWLQLWGINSTLPADMYPDLFGFKWRNKGHTIPVALTQGFNDICPGLSDCEGATMDLEMTWDGLRGYIAGTSVYASIASVFILLRCYQSWLRIRAMYPFGLNTLQNPAFYIIAIQLLAAPIDFAYFLDYMVVFGVFNTYTVHALETTSTFFASFTTAMLAILQLHVSRQFLPKYYIIIGSILAVFGVILLEIGAILFYFIAFGAGVTASSDGRVVGLTGLITLTTVFISTRIYLLSTIRKGTKAEDAVARVSRMSKLLFLSALFMVVWIIFRFMSIAWISWPWSPIYFWTFRKASLVMSGPMAVIAYTIVPFLHVYALPYKSERTGSRSINKSVLGKNRIAWHGFISNMWAPP